VGSSSGGQIRGVRTVGVGGRSGHNECDRTTSEMRGPSFRI
jgi:hypothetical protein